MTPTPALRHRRVQATTAWLEPVTLWSCVVAPSGDRKTPGFAVILRALYRIEKENAPQCEEKHRIHQTRVQVAKEVMRRWRKACHEAVNANPPRDPPPMPIDAVDIGDLIEPALHVQDATIQRLGKLCVARPRGMMIIRDELSGLFAGMSHQPGARAFYLEAWNGGRFVVERVDESRSFTVPNLLVGVVGGFQPDRLARAFEGDEDGMSGRFLFGWPASPDYSRLTDEVSEVEPEFQSLLMHLIRLPDEDVDAKFAPRVIPLSRGARDTFEGYRRYVDNLKRGLDRRERQWFVKSESQVLRLAATLAYLSWASSPPSGAALEVITAAMEPDEVTELSMANATKLMREYFWPHARASLRQIGLTDRHRHLRRALRWIRANRLSVIPSRTFDARRWADALIATRPATSWTAWWWPDGCASRKLRPAVDRSRGGGSIREYSKPHLQKLQKQHKGLSCDILRLPAVPARDNRVLICPPMRRRGHLPAQSAR
jgi:hypothetical protein